MWLLWRDLLAIVLQHVPASSRLLGHSRLKEEKRRSPLPYQRAKRKQEIEACVAQQGK